MAFDFADFRSGSCARFCLPSTELGAVRNQSQIALLPVPFVPGTRVLSIDFDLDVGQETMLDDDIQYNFVEHFYTGADVPLTPDVRLPPTPNPPLENERHTLKKLAKRANVSAKARCKGCCGSWDGGIECVLGQIALPAHQRVRCRSGSCRLRHERTWGSLCRRFRRRWRR
eukprot:3337426-Rhodomonas_salina.1